MIRAKVDAVDAARSESRSAFKRVSPARGQQLYIDPGNGRDSNSGSTRMTALASIDEACRRARPGSRIRIAGGRYPSINGYGLRGHSGAWIVLEALDDGDPPIIDPGSSSTNGVDIQQSAYVGLWGLRVESRGDPSVSDSSGIAIFRGSRFIRVWNCVVGGFPGGGINCFWTPATRYRGHDLPAGGWDCVDLSFNRISGCCRYSSFNTSGISFFGAASTSEDTLDGGWGYRARGNVITDCECVVPNSVDGFDFVTDGNGISVDSLVVRNHLAPDLPPYRKRGLIEGNFVARNGGRGLHVYNSAYVVDRHNVFDSNLRTVSPAFIGAAETEATGTMPPDIAAATIAHASNVIRPRADRHAIEGPGSRTANLILPSAGSAAPS